VFCISASFFFLRLTLVTFSLILSIFIFNLFLALFIVFSVSFSCSFRAPMSSFICCVFSHSLFLFILEFLECLLYVLVDHV
jgi:hypothetical protein